MTTPNAIDIPRDRLVELAGRWLIDELAIFGSAVRTDFGPDSDVDVLVTFHPAASWTLWDFVELKSQLESLFGRPVDLVEKRALRNPYRRRHILETARVLYAS